MRLDLAMIAISEIIEEVFPTIFRALQFRSLERLADLTRPPNIYGWQRTRWASSQEENGSLDTALVHMID